MCLMVRTENERGGRSIGGGGGALAMRDTQLHFVETGTAPNSVLSGEERAGYMDVIQ